ncbi:NUMOD4 domain-containing protein [Hymenobacter sp. M29]|uniref:NUMOD4 domain-containing protein n=1 Tax=Hymenobacter mellowenesis TaxID=3063995 RepID=A0ABT9ACS6_9BACT|nr:NUMOD4 domain-containing protein [Hymenobacter sp. M29]MDO7847650.1 NUMOD4 domain-containing protein [Hymenobacter sp. M29]
MYLYTMNLTPKERSRIPQWFLSQVGWDHAYKWWDLEDLEGEEWTSVVGFDGYYEVSNLGRVKSCSRLVRTGGGGERLVIPRILKAGLTTSKKLSQYFLVNLSVDGVSKVQEVHRLVATAFLEETHAHSVLHRNQNTLDNRKTNLYYGTQKERAQKAWDEGNQYSVNLGKFGRDSQSSKPISMLDLEGNSLQIFPAVIEAAQWLVDQGKAKPQPLQNIMSNLRKVVNGKYPYAYSHRWANPLSTKNQEPQANP